METAIWVIAIITAIVITIIYVITSVGSYSDSFVGKFFKGGKNKDDEDKN